MKKLLIIMITVSVIITSLVLIVCARQEDNYTYVIQFQETNKAYPIMNSEEDAIGFLSYYEVDNLIYNYYNAQGTETSMFLTISSNGITITTGQITGSYPMIDYSITSDTYDDFGLIYKNENYYIVVWENGEPHIEENWDNISDGMSFSYNTDKNYLSNDYYVQFPTPPIPSETTNIITLIVETIGEFINGIGYWFSNAFTIIFLDNGSPNTFAITLLIFFGVTLAYGVVRYVVGLFRKET